MAAQGPTLPVYDDEEGPDVMDPDDLSPEEAADEFADMLLNLQYHGRLSAMDVCVLSLLAARCGLRGRTERLACNPLAQSGEFERHLDTV